jgi:hypothetical protein
MPPLEQEELDQKALYWEFTEDSDEYGQPVVSATPLELDVRWEYTQRQMVDPFGKLVAIDAMVVADRKLKVDSKMWLGELSEWLGVRTGSGGEEPDSVMYVKTYNRIPDLKGREVRHEVGLAFYRDSPDPRQG